MVDRIGVAFVGCTHPHIFPRVDILRGEPDVTLVGCYDPDPAIAAGIEERCGLKSFGSADELLDQPGVNFAVIEGWEKDNPGYVAKALERGQAIMLEKPGAANLPAMRALIDGVRAKPVPFQVGYMMHDNSAIRHARRILAEGVLGPVTLARVHAATPVGGSREIWQSQPDDLGGLMYTDACHAVDMIVSLFGIPKHVNSLMLKLPEGESVTAHGFKKDTLSQLDVTVEMPIGGLVHEDAGAAILRYADKIVTLDMTGWEAHPWVEAWRIEIYGANGTLHVALTPPAYRLYVRNAKAGYQPGWHEWSGLSASVVGNSLEVDENYSSEVHNMLARVRRWDTDNAQSIREAEGVITILSAMYDSERDGKMVEVQSRV
ncbi:Gfo/Idh/MocA family oxidoreductase [Mesorhizobium sp. YM1C-6-2]|uniref:Gfo/Idh/MocA family protein n=1 Tax=Mesorhizobium sp. YM1C-6-2 TaxID=1827501 RepID=UPI000EF2537F|nr:Gfo/Idh/MocA family oxidoreductase [Mesorhizobium sp. YM1C-6-2]RLP28189.1 gfo/Idh/MocA family oxidoreductase [Mesorhizobium sp. YM1C-6-2]